MGGKGIKKVVSDRNMQWWLEETCIKMNGNNEL